MVWLLRDTLATHIVGEKAHSGSVGWLALAVALSVVSASQAAIVQGMRKIVDLAKLSVFSTVLSALVGVVIILKFGYEGLVAFITVAPTASVFFGIYFVKRSAGVSKFRFQFSEVVSKLGVMTKLGIALFVYALLEQFSFLLIRAHIGNALGVVELGYFQAGWTVAVMYLGVITGAMSSDFMPRIAERKGDNDSIN